jgi:ketosteroid isomerase-like protein
MSTYAVLDLEAIKNAVHNGGAAGLTEYLTDDVEFIQIDQRTPPAGPAVYTGREALIALAEDLERRGIRMQVDDGFISGDRGALRVVCTYPDGNQVVEHTLLTLRDGKVARWSGVQAWDA